RLSSSAAIRLSTSTWRARGSSNTSCSASARTVRRPASPSRTASSARARPTPICGSARMASCTGSRRRRRTESRSAGTRSSRDPRPLSRSRAHLHARAGRQARLLPSHGTSISADGRYVVFTSEAGNLVPGDSNEATDVFLHDRQTGETTRVSIASSNTQAIGFSGDGEISADGRYVAFDSYARNLVPNDTNGGEDVYLR